MQNPTIAILGLGKLGQRIASCLRKAGFDQEKILAFSRQSNQDAISELGITAVDSENIDSIDILVLTVKHHQFNEAWQQIKPTGNPIIISFMANVSIEKIGRITGSKRIVRAMTTTSCEIGKGIGLYTVARDVSNENVTMTHIFLANLGRHDLAEQEQEVEVYATVLSSLTGMVYQLLADCERGMNHIGAPKRYRELVLEAFASSVSYAQHRSDSHFLTLSDEVTSPGGTTDAARLVMNKHRCTFAIIKAIEAAANKASGK